jgi:hypothetical protein
LDKGLDCGKDGAFWIKGVADHIDWRLSPLEFHDLFAYVFALSRFVTQASRSHSSRQTASLFALTSLSSLNSPSFSKAKKHQIQSTTEMNTPLELSQWPYVNVTFEPEAEVG